jgi:hypothetical protein
MAVGIASLASMSFARQGAYQVLKKGEGGGGGRAGSGQMAPDSFTFFEAGK